MNQFEYEVTKHRADEFIKFVYFCTEQGECSLDQVPQDQTRIFADLLNKKGADGWEMVQVLPGKGGMAIIWKRSRTS